MENIQSYLKEIVKNLGDGWQYVGDDDPRYPGCKVKHPTGKTFTLHVDNYRNKLEVWGSFPYHNGSAVLYGEEYPKRIYANVDRTPDSVAKDIKRRFLPNYEKAFALYQERIAERKRNEQKVAATLEELGTVLNKHPRQDSNALHWTSPNVSGGWADFEINPDSVTIKAYSLPISKALAIAKILVEG